jgi:hypothetical protein
MIYTTNFASLRKLPSDIIPISISAKAPEWYNGIQYKKLAPKYDFFMKWKQNHDNQFYIEHFQKEVLDMLFPSEVVLQLLLKVRNIKGLNYSPEIALVCYEPKPPKDMTFEDIIKDDSKYFCHRHLVAVWFRDNGFDVREF